MARNFNGSSAYLEAASAAVTAEPLTMACWFRPSDLVASHVPMSIGTGGGISRFQIVEAMGGAGSSCVCTAFNAAGTGSSATAGGAAVSGVWQHFAGVFASSTSRTAYFNGGNPGSDTTSITVSGLNRTVIGARIATTAGAYSKGDIALVGIWNAALTASEILRLAQGVIPETVRPQNLVFYNPLDDRWTYDRSRGLFLTDVGPTGAAEDPPFLQKPRRKYFLFGETAAAASVIFRNRTGSRARLIA